MACDILKDHRPISQWRRKLRDPDELQIAIDIWRAAAEDILGGATEVPGFDHLTYLLCSLCDLKFVARKPRAADRLSKRTDQARVGIELSPGSGSLLSHDGCCRGGTTAQ